MKNKSLEYLVGEVVKHNEEAFNELYRRYYKLVYYIAFQLTKNSSDADDVLQETFLQMQKSIHDLRDAKQFKAWIGRIAYSKSMKLFQKQKDANLSDAQLQVLSNQMESRSDFLPEHSMHYEHDMKALDHCIANLKHVYREVLLLYYFAQLNIREIALTLNIPEGTVKSRLLYGKKYLKTEIDVYQEQTGERITFKGSSLETLLVGAGASLSSTSLVSGSLPFKHISIPPTTMLLIAKVAAITTLASGAVVGGYSLYEQNKEEATPPQVISKSMISSDPFPTLWYKEKQVDKARIAYETLLEFAHCEVEMAQKSKEEFAEIFPVYQAVESYGGTYQQLLHRNSWVEEFLKYNEL